MKLKKLILLFILLFLIFFLGYGSENKTLKVVTAVFEPFSMEKDDKFEGLDIDILEAFAQEKGYSLKFETLSFQQIWEKLDLGEADLACGALYFTEERAKKYLLSNSYFTTGLVIVSSSNLLLNRVDELKYRKIGVKKNATGEKFAQELNSRNFYLKIVPFNTTKECFDALARGEIDALLNDYISSRIIINKNYLGDMVISSSSLGISYLEENDLVFYFSKERKKEIEDFNQFLEKFKKSGKLDRLKKRWVFEAFIPSKKLYLRFFFLALFLITLIVVFALYQRKILSKKALLISEKRFKELVYEAPIAIIIHKDGNLLFANKELYQMFGYKKEDLHNGFPVIKLFAEGEHHKLLFYLEARKKDEDVPFSYEVYGLKSDGVAFPVEVDVSIVNFSNEKVTILFIKDISDKKKVFEELRKSEEKFRKVFESVSEGIFISSKEGKPLLANPALIKMLGYETLDEVLERDIEKEGYLDPNERKRFQDIMEKEGKVENFETVWLKKDKTPIYVIESAHALRDNKGYIFAYEGTVRDITERKKNEDLLRESEIYYRSLFENAHDAIMVFDPENEIIIDANQLCLKMYGFSREEIIGLSLETISKDVKKGKERINELHKKGKLNNFETVHYCKDGKEIILEINASLIYHKGKAAVLSINRDITQKKLSEKIIVERNKQLLAFLESALAMGSFTDLKFSAESICRSVINTFSLEMACIGLVVPESTELKVIASAGLDEGYTDKVSVRWDESERAKGPTGRCIVKRIPVVMSVDDPDFLPWRDEAVKRGFKVVCAFPLIHEDSVRGALTLFSRDPNAITPFAMETFEIFARLAGMTVVTASLYEEANQTVQELLDSGREKEKLYKELERKSLQYQMSEKKFRNIVEKARGILLTFDTEGIITYFNEYAQEFFGFKEDEILGKSLFETIVPIEESTTGRDLKLLLKDIMLDPNKYASNINENITKSGKRVWIAWTNRPILDENGKIKEILSVGTDITELKLSQIGFEKYRTILAEVFSTGMGIIFEKDFDGNLLSSTFNKNWDIKIKEKWERVLKFLAKDQSSEIFLENMRSAFLPIHRILEIEVSDGEFWKILETGRTVLEKDSKKIVGFLVRIF